MVQLVDPLLSLYQPKPLTPLPLVPSPVQVVGPSEKQGTPVLERRALTVAQTGFCRLSYFVGNGDVDGLMTHAPRSSVGDDMVGVRVHVITMSQEG